MPWYRNMFLFFHININDNAIFKRNLLFPLFFFFYFFYSSSTPWPFLCYLQALEIRAGPWIPGKKNLAVKFTISGMINKMFLPHQVCFILLILKALVFSIAYYQEKVRRLTQLAPVVRWLVPRFLETFFFLLSASYKRC